MGRVQACSLFTACVRVMYLPALPVFFLALPIEFLSLNFFLRAGGALF